MQPAETNPGILSGEPSAMRIKTHYAAGDHLHVIQGRDYRKIKIIIVDDINQKIVKRVQDHDNASKLIVEPFPISHHIS